MTVVPLHRDRTRTIGGSDAAAACGVDPHRSKIMLWLEKTGRIERPTSEAMAWGNVLQGPIMDELRERGYDVRVPPPSGETYADRERPWCTGHPDGFVFDLGDDDATGLLEVKTTNGWAYRAAGDIPVQYAAQVQHYLHLTGLERALLAILVGGQRLELRELRRDQAVIDRMLDLEERFHWHLVTDTPPAPDGSASAREALTALYPEAVPERVVRLDKGQMALVAELRARKSQADAIEAQQRELENLLKLAMGDAEVALSPADVEVLRWPTVHSNRIDTSRLRGELPAVAEQFTTTTTTRRFSLA